MSKRVTDGSVSRQPGPKYTKEQLANLGEMAFNRKMEALDDSVIVKPSSEWRVITTNWESASAEQRSDMVFGLAFYSGFKAKDMARLFRIKTTDLSEFKDIIDQGLMALKHKITSNQIAFGLSTEQPVVKFHLGKQFAEQVDNPAHEGVNTVEASIPNIVINEVKHNNEELRNELEAAVQAAMRNGSSSTLRAVK